MLIVIGLLCVLLLGVANCAKVSPICPTGTPAVDARGQYTYCAASADASSSCPGDDEGLSYCSKLGLCCCNDSSATCPNCVVPLNCSSDVCKVKTCPNYPKATCLVNYCASCQPHFYVGKEEVTASCLEPPRCKGKIYGGHCLDDDCVLIEVNGELTDRCRQKGGECLVDLNNNVRCFTDLPRKKPRKKDDDDEEEEEEEDDEEDDCYPLPYCPPDKPTKPPRPTPADDDDDTMSTVSTATGTTTTSTGTTGTGTTGTGTMTTGTGTTGTGTMTTDTASTGTASTATTNDGTASTGTTNTASTDTASTGTASTATTNDGTASTGTTNTASTDTASTGTASTATTNDGTASTGTTNTASTGTASAGTASTATTKASKKSSKKGSKSKRHLRLSRKDVDYERNISEDNPHYYRRYQRYYYDN